MMAFSGFTLGLRRFYCIFMRFALVKALCSAMCTFVSRCNATYAPTACTSGAACSPAVASGVLYCGLFQCTIPRSPLMLGVHFLESIDNAFNHGSRTRKLAVDNTVGLIIATGPQLALDYTSSTKRTEC